MPTIRVDELVDYTLSVVYANEESRTDPAGECTFVLRSPEMLGQQPAHTILIPVPGEARGSLAALLAGTAPAPAPSPADELAAQVAEQATEGRCKACGEYIEENASCARLEAAAVASGHRGVEALAERGCVVALASIDGAS